MGRDAMTSDPMPVLSSLLLHTERVTLGLFGPCFTSGLGSYADGKNKHFGLGLVHSTRHVGCRGFALFLRGTSDHRHRLSVNGNWQCLRHQTSTGHSPAGVTEISFGKFPRQACDSLRWASIEKGERGGGGEGGSGGGAATFAVSAPQYRCLVAI